MVPFWLFLCGYVLSKKKYKKNDESSCSLLANGDGVCANACAWPLVVFVHESRGKE